MTNVIFPGINTDNSGDVYAGANSNLAYEEMNTLANTSKPIDIGGGIFIILANSADNALVNRYIANVNPSNLKREKFWCDNLAITPNSGRAHSWFHALLPYMHKNVVFPFHLK